MAPCFLDGPFLRLAHPVFYLGEGLFDWVEVWRIWRQALQPSTGSPDCSSDSSCFVAPQVIHDDDVARLEHGEQLLIDMGAGAFAV